MCESDALWRLASVVMDTLFNSRPARVSPHRSASCESRPYLDVFSSSIQQNAESWLSVKDVTCFYEFTVFYEALQSMFVFILPL